MSAKFREMHGSFIELPLQRWGLLLLKSMSKSTLKYIIKCKTLRNGASEFNIKLADDTYRKTGCALNVSYYV
jgi:hypothetical protein